MVSEESSRGRCRRQLNTLVKNKRLCWAYISLGFNVKKTTYFTSLNHDVMSCEAAVVEGCVVERHFHDCVYDDNRGEAHVEQRRK